MHRSYGEAGESPFGIGFAIVDPEMPKRVAADAKRMHSRGLIQLCTTTDAWSPEAQQYDLGRKCLQAILDQPGWSVRILTKNAAVRNDFDLIQKHRDRFLVGLSITASEDRSALVSAVEPFASSIEERIEVLREAHKLGLRTYGMLCPLLPGIADNPRQIDELVRIVLDSGAEDIFAEAVNGRGPALRMTEEALRVHGFTVEADAVGAIRKEANWSPYVVRLLDSLQQTLRRRGALPKLRFLLYPSGLAAGDLRWMRNHSEGVKWLGDGS
jgi:DNA repair photolyase